MIIAITGKRVALVEAMVVLTVWLILQNQMSKKEILAKYRVHIFVVAIFIISVLFISLGWFYRDKTEQEDSARQKIFLDPRKRILTLSDGHDEVHPWCLTGHLTLWLICVWMLMSVCMFVWIFIFMFMSHSCGCNYVIAASRCNDSCSCLARCAGQCLAGSGHPAVAAAHALSAGGGRQPQLQRMFVEKQRRGAGQLLPGASRWRDGHSGMLQCILGNPEILRVGGQLL